MTCTLDPTCEFGPHAAEEHPCGKKPEMPHSSRGNMTATTALLPHAGFQVTVMRPDGVSYPALLCRFDGPHGGIAVLYTNPGDFVDGPDDVPMYEHRVYVEELAEGCQVHTLSLTAEQEQDIRDYAR